MGQRMVDFNREEESKLNLGTQHISWITKIVDACLIG